MIVIKSLIRRFVSKIPAEIREHHDGIDSIFDPCVYSDHHKGVAQGMDGRLYQTCFCIPGTVPAPVELLT